MFNTDLPINEQIFEKMKLLWFLSENKVRLFLNGKGYKINSLKELKDFVDNGVKKSSFDFSSFFANFPVTSNSISQAQKLGLKIKMS